MIAALISRASASARVESIVAKRIASRLPASGRRVAARLHDRRVQVEVVRHHRRADDADGEVEHRRVGDDARPGHEAGQHRRQLRAAARRSGTRSRRRPVATSAMIAASSQRKPRLCNASRSITSSSGDDDARHERQAEQQVEADRHADHLRQVAGDDRHFAEQPERPVRGRREVAPARLRQVDAGAEAQPHGGGLEQHRHQVREQDDREQRVAELRAGGERGRPVAGVHVADCDQVTGAEEKQHAAPGGALRRRTRGGDRSVDLGEARPSARQLAAQCSLHPRHRRIHQSRKQSTRLQRGGHAPCRAASFGASRLRTRNSLQRWSLSLAFCASMRSRATCQSASLHWRSS